MATIRLNKQNKTIKVVNRKETIRLKKQETKINLSHTGKVGPQGEKGDQGDIGVGVPTGGAENQVLQKASSEDYDFQWLTPTFEDKYYTTTFGVSSSVLVEHHLNKYPAVTIHDSAGDEVEGTITHEDTQKLTLTFSAPFSGRVTCN